MANGPSSVTPSIRRAIGGIGQEVARQLTALPARSAHGRPRSPATRRHADSPRPPAGHPIRSGRRSCPRRGLRRCDGRTQRTACRVCAVEGRHRIDANGSFGLRHRDGSPRHRHLVRRQLAPKRVFPRVRVSPSHTGGLISIGDRDSPDVGVCDGYAEGSPWVLCEAGRLLRCGLSQVEGRCVVGIGCRRWGGMWPTTMCDVPERTRRPGT